MRLLRIVPLCVASVVVGCAAESVHPIVGGAASPMRVGETDVIGSTGPIPVTVVGDAFGLDRGALEQAITQDMQGAAWAHARFVPASGFRDRSVRPQDARVVMLLNPPTGADAVAYCSAGEAPSAISRAAPRPGGRVVELSGALCQNDKGLRWVRTGVDGVSSADDPAFRKMVRQATTELMLSSGEPNIFHGTDDDH